MARGFTSLNLSQRPLTQQEVDDLRHGTAPSVGAVSLPPAPKWHGGVAEKVVAGALLGILAFLWSSGATAVERLGKIPQHELRLNKHDERFDSIERAQEAEAKGRERLVDLLEQDAKDRVRVRRELSRER